MGGLQNVPNQSAFTTSAFEDSKFVWVLGTPPPRYRRILGTSGENPKNQKRVFGGGPESPKKRVILTRLLTLFDFLKDFLDPWCPEALVFWGGSGRKGPKYLCSLGEYSQSKFTKSRDASLRCDVLLQSTMWIARFQGSRWDPNQRFVQCDVHRRKSPLQCDAFSSQLFGALDAESSAMQATKQHQSNNTIRAPTPQKSWWTLPVQSWGWCILCS